MKKIFVLLLTMAMVLSCLTGCFGSSGNDDSTTTDPDTGETVDVIELTFYYPTQTAGALAIGMEEIVAEFNASHPGIKVTPVYTGAYKATAEKVMTSIQGGNAPNVVLSGMLDIIDYVNIDALHPLDELIAAEGDEWKNDFVEGFWGNFGYNGETVGIPYQHSTPVLYCNMDMLKAAGVEKAPATWDELIAAVRAIKAYDEDIVPVEFPADVWILEAFTLSLGGELCTDMQTPTFDSAEAVEGLQFMSTLVNDEDAVMIADWGTAAEDFVAESCAMMINTTGNLGAVSTGATYEWSVNLVPVKDSSYTPAFSYGGGGLIMLDAQSDEEKAASWEFMKYLTEPENTAKWATISGYYPVRKSADDNADLQAYYETYPQLQQAAEMLQYAGPQWATDNYWDVYNYMTLALDEVLVNGGDAAAALAEAQSGAEGAVAG